MSQESPLAERSAGHDNGRRRRHFAVIPAAGAGSRMQAATPKQYLPIAGKPMLRHVVDTFVATPSIEHVFVVVGEDDERAAGALAGMAGVSTNDAPARVTLLRCGGATRRDTVLNALAAIADRVAGDDWILVHDAARPGLTRAMIESLQAALAADDTGGLLALPVADTLKRAGGDGRAAATVDRDGLWAAQTPQMFPHALLRRALTLCAAVTDEAGAIEALGMTPRLVPGHPRNFKVTLPHDLLLAALYLKEEHV